MDNTGQQMRKKNLLFFTQYHFLGSYDTLNSKMTFIFAHSISFLQEFIAQFSQNITLFYAPVMLEQA